jgi:hypothetical protein
MKNLLLLLVLLSNGPLFSQVKSEDSLAKPPKGKFILSAIGGLNISKMPFRYSETSSELVIPETRSEYAFFGGLAARQPLTSKFSVLLDANYAVRGFGYLSSNEISRFRFEYLDFVPQAEYKVLNNVYVSLGGYLSFRFNEFTKIGESSWYKVNPDLVQFANDVDFGIVPGITLRFDRVSVLARYQYGLVSSSELEVSDGTGTPLGIIGRHNRTFQIGLGFRVL